MKFVKPAPTKKPAIGVRKISLSLPPDVVANLDTLSSSMGLSRSAFLSALLTESLPPMITTLSSISDLIDEIEGSDVSPAVAQQRYNAGSKDAINAFLRSVVGGVQDDLFKG